MTITISECTGPESKIQRFCITGNAILSGDLTKSKMVKSTFDVRKTAIRNIVCSG